MCEGLHRRDSQKQSAWPKKDEYITLSLIQCKHFQITLTQCPLSGPGSFPGLPANGGGRLLLCKWALTDAQGAEFLVQKAPGKEQSVLDL